MSKLSVQPDHPRKCSLTPGNVTIRISHDRGHWSEFSAGSRHAVDNADIHICDSKTVTTGWPCSSAYRDLIGFSKSAPLRLLCAVMKLVLSLRFSSKELFQPLLCKAFLPWGVAWRPWQVHPYHVKLNREEFRNCMQWDNVNYSQGAIRLNRAIVFRGVRPTIEPLEIVDVNSKWIVQKDREISTDSPTSELRTGKTLPNPAFWDGMRSRTLKPPRIVEERRKVQEIWKRQRLTEESSKLRWIWQTKPGNSSLLRWNAWGRLGNSACRKRTALLVLQGELRPDMYAFRT